LENEIPAGSWSASSSGIRPLRTKNILFVFENNSFHVVRPDALAYWTKTVALNDADEIYRMVLQMK